MSAVTISTGSRLHFGLLTHRPESGREFGGVGVMIDSPGWTILIETRRAGDDSIVGLSADAAAVSPQAEQRIRSILARCQDNSPALRCPVRVFVGSAIPSHRGLGSGTQLSLAVARCLDILLAGGQRPANELAQLSGRGQRSAVGTWGFEYGGCILEGGRTEHDQVGRLISHLPFPEQWRFLLITPRSGAGLSGGDEKSAFERLPGMSTELTGELCRIAVMQLLPAIQAVDFDAAADGLDRYGQLAGEYFIPVQNGVFLHPAMNALSEKLRASGVIGFAQTSWGPTCFVLCRDKTMALDVRNTVRQTPGSDELRLEIAAPRNSGAMR
jgi:beta-RFAP synthase